MDAVEFWKPFAFAQNLFDDRVERSRPVALRIADQPAQALKILRGIAQAVDVVEPKSLQSVFRYQGFHEGMDGVEGAGILDTQSRQRIDVEKASVVDVAGGEPPMAEPVVLAFEQVMQRERLRCPIGAGTIGGGRCPSSTPTELSRERARLAPIPHRPEPVARVVGCAPGNPTTDVELDPCDPARSVRSWP